MTLAGNKIFGAGLLLALAISPLMNAEAKEPIKIDDAFWRQLKDNGSMQSMWNENGKETIKKEFFLSCANDQGESGEFATHKSRNFCMCVANKLFANSAYTDAVGKLAIVLILMKQGHVFDETSYQEFITQNEGFKKGIEEEATNQCSKD